jgi:high-affinity iron transporter
MGGGRREVMEGVVSLVAAAALLAAGHWVLARLDAQRRVEAIKRRIREATSGARRRWALAGLAFLAVFREAFEVVLFLRTIALDAGTSGALLAGVGVGTVLLVAAVFALVRLGRRVKPGPLLAGMGTMLCVLAVIFAGKGIHALQAADVISVRLLPLPVVEWLGLYPTLQGVMAQLLVLGAFVGIAGVAILRSRARSAA